MATRTSAHDAVIAAALAWNRARLHRAACQRAKRQAEAEVEAGGRSTILDSRCRIAGDALTVARDAEAAAKAALRKACMTADPGCQVLNIRANAHHAPSRRLPAPDVIDV